MRYPLPLVGREKKVRSRKKVRGGGSEAAEGVAAFTTPPDTTPPSPHKGEGEVKVNGSIRTVWPRTRSPEIPWRGDRENASDPSLKAVLEAFAAPLRHAGLEATARTRHSLARIRPHMIA